MVRYSITATVMFGWAAQTLSVMVYAQDNFSPVYNSVRVAEPEGSDSDTLAATVAVTRKMVPFSAYSRTVF